MKKILITTLRQGVNYGGILQAYSLQQALKNLGHTPESTSTPTPPQLRSRLINLIPGLRFTILVARGGEKSATIAKNTSSFINTRLKITSFDNARRGRYNAYITGSDQVWRGAYTYVPHNLFSFVKNKGALKISYAASFGRDNLEEYGPHLIKKTKKLAQQLDGISVRESSGVNIVKNNWGLTAEHHVDPTLLLDANIYRGLIESPTCDLYTPEGNLFSYVLDPAEGKQRIADIVAKSQNLRSFTVIDGDENNGKPMPPVEQWLRSLHDAQYIVTDSFHGTVFAIIFNRPFIAIGNKERGLARFTSLLKMFDLEDRLITSIDDLSSELINKPINWSAVNTKIKSEQKRSLDYLKKHLG